MKKRRARTSHSYLLQPVVPKTKTLDPKTLVPYMVVTADPLGNHWFDPGALMDLVHLLRCLFQPRNLSVSKLQNRAHHLKFGLEPWVTSSLLARIVHFFVQPKGASRHSSRAHHVDSSPAVAPSSPGRPKREGGQLEEAKQTENRNSRDTPKRNLFRTL